MKKMTVLGLLVAFAFALGAQQPPAQPSSQYFGLGAGATAGVGFSYRSWKDDWGFQVNGIPLISNGTFSGSLGVLALDKIHETHWTRYFGYFGAATALSMNGGALDGFVVLGGGYGIEMIFFDHIALDLQAGLGVSYNPYLGELVYAGPTGEAGIYYRL